MAAESRNAIERLGAAFIAAMSWAGGLTVLLGQMLKWTLLGLVTRRARFRWGSLAEQVIRVGVKSVLIIALVQLFIGVILALQMTRPLEQYGSQDQISVIIGVAGFRMLAPIITGVVLSGFAGASIAAELGTMVVAEEIEALEATALDPVWFLVVPRVLATLLMTVLLSVMSDMMIALGGYLTAWLVLGPTVYIGYWDRMRDALTYRDLMTGLIQAAVFGLLISLIACQSGLKVRGGAEGVGRATTMTVVYSIVTIIAASCACTMIFYVFEL